MPFVCEIHTGGGLHGVDGGMFESVCVCALSQLLVTDNERWVTAVEVNGSPER